MIDYEAISSFEGSYPRVFERLRRAGWRPGEPTGRNDLPRWLNVPGLPFWENDFATSFVIELGGKQLDGAPALRFYPGPAITRLLTIEYISLHINDLISDTAYPVAEDGQSILFVDEDRTAARVDASLHTCVHAPDPFLLIRHQLTGDPDPRLRRQAVSLS